MREAEPGLMTEKPTTATPTRGKRVCVIGAGISGLVSAKVMLGDGFDVTLFEKGADLGGVWAPSRTYPELHTNNPRDTYAFSDHPYPATAADFPSAEEVREYLNSYARRFGLSARIRFNTTVEMVFRAVSAEDGGWRVVVRIGDESAPDQTLHFDYVVVCNGVFSQPKLPPVEEIERFTGRVIHSSELTDRDDLSGKRVIVVGAGKSAHDCATWIAGRAKSCTFLFRRAHWMVPRYWFGLINCQWFIFSKFTENALPSYSRGADGSVRARTVGPIARLQWRVAAGFFRRQLRIPPELVPETPLPEGFFLGGISSGQFYRLVKAGSITPKKGSFKHLGANGTVELDGGESLQADVVVFATGWCQTISFLDQTPRDRIERDGRFFLYRMILPVGVPNLGFIGYNTSTSHQLTAEVAAHWLSEYFLGSLHVPDAEQMEREVRLLHQWMERTMPNRVPGIFVGPYVLHYIDELLTDMGLRTRRKRNFVTENLMPAWPSRYAKLGEERRLSATTSPPPDHLTSRR